ncbi:MAG TPA: hypothetical protein VMQ11_03205 [Alphaproteobacteria bacterium]|nr:hypothetical protein [Alphaproteobacteria bacterium]
MNSNYSDIAAAWIVALALIAAIVAHVFLPATPPRLGHGVADADAARVGINLSGATESSDSDLPLNELRDVFRLHFGDATAASADSSAAPSAQ